MIADAGAHGESVDFLVQGTLYPDVVESGGGSGTANIKTVTTSAACRRTLEFAPGRAAAVAFQGRGAPRR